MKTNLINFVILFVMACVGATIFGGLADIFGYLWFGAGFGAGLMIAASLIIMDQIKRGATSVVDQNSRIGLSKK